MKVTIVKIAPAAFTGADGKPVNGTYFYYRDPYGGSVRRMFMTADSVFLVESVNGKVVDMLENFDV